MRSYEAHFPVGANTYEQSFTWGQRAPVDLLQAIRAESTYTDAS